MKTFMMNYRLNKYRYVTLNVDRCTEHIFQGRIWHEALLEEAVFGGWIDLMMVVNQIYDRTNIPRRTLDLRSFEPVAEKSLRWRSSEDEHALPSPFGTLMTFRIFLAYRYHASWQGNIYCQEQNKYYEFTSFLELVRLMDCLMKGLEPEQCNIEQGRCSCHLAVNGYEGKDICGEVQNASNNWARQFLNAAVLIEDMLDLHAAIKDNEKNGSERIINRESVEFFRTGGSKATFSVRILYQQNTEWQGYIYCRELQEEKAFRSFMEMLYLMASVLDEHTVAGTKDNYHGTNVRNYTYMIG